MSYLALWADVYRNPIRFADSLPSKPAPAWGFLAALQRALMDSILLYLPLFLIGRVPPERSYVSFIPDKLYYGTLIGLSPIVLLAEWLLAAATMHLILRLMSRRSDFDQILNITGFVGLGIGSVLLLWDWSWLLIGGMNQYWLGISHLLIDVWGIVVTIISFMRILQVPISLGIVLNLVGIAVAMPFAIMFMRSPL